MASLPWEVVCHLALHDQCRKPLAQREFPESAVLTANLLKPEVCQCLPNLGGINLHILRKPRRYLRGCHILRLRLGAGMHEVGDDKLGGGVGSHEVAVVVVQSADVGVVEPVALATIDEDDNIILRIPL